MAKARDLLGTRSQINGIFLQKGYTRLSGILSVPLKDSLRVSSSGSSILKFLGVKPLARAIGVTCLFWTLPELLATGIYQVLKEYERSTQGLTKGITFRESEIEVA